MSEARAGAAAKPNLAKRRLIEVRGLDKTFYDADREIRVLRGLDLTVQAGEEIAIVGQSGTGKSTLLHIMGSLEEPTAGKVYFEGEDLFALDQKSLAEFRNLKLGFVFQFHYLLADFTALENVMMPALIGRINDAEASRRATDMLEIVGLGDKLGRRPAELSDATPPTCPSGHTATRRVLSVFATAGKAAGSSAPAGDFGGGGCGPGCACANR